MRIQVISDIHSEFAPYTYTPTDADVVVLAGDIGKEVKGVAWASSSIDRPVVYVCGNHECYKGAVPRIFEKLGAEASRTPNVSFLENSSVVIGGVRFLGCTLWTDFELYGVEEVGNCMTVAGSRMNDYRQIRTYPQYHRLKPVDTKLRHMTSKRWLREQLSVEFAGPTVVVTHHSPSRKSIDPLESEGLLDAAYASNLEPLMKEFGIDLWIHGHTHFCVDYTVGNTRVVSNQRGYPDQDVRGFRDDFVIEIGT